MERDADRQVSSEMFVRCVSTVANILENVRTRSSVRVRGGVDTKKTDENVREQWFCSCSHLVETRGDGSSSDMRRLSLLNKEFALLMQ